MLDIVDEMSTVWLMSKALCILIVVLTCGTGRACLVNVRTVAVVLGA